MKKLLFLAVGIIGCTNPNAEQKHVVDHQLLFEDIEKNLLPAHYLKGEEIKKTIAQMMAEDKIQGVSLAIINDGTIPLIKTYGFSDLQDSTKVSPSTLFNGASLSKPITAMAALRLVEQGILDLNEDVNNKLKGWKIPESSFTVTEKVTLKRLLGHRAGFGRYVQSAVLPNQDLPTITQMLAGEKPSVDPPVQVVYVPGQKQVYSNPGYSVIEKLMEDATGQNFEIVLDELIFEPANMKQSTFEQPVPVEFKKLIATGYSSDLTAYPYKLFPYKAAGGIWTTPTDLAKFLIALLKDHYSETNIILSKKMTDSIFAKTPSRFGFAKIYNDTIEDVLLEHWGSNSGFTCYMVASVSRKQGLIIMTNSDNGIRLMSYIARSVALAYDWEFLKPNVYEPIELNKGDLTSFTGKFTGGNEILEFTIKKGKLYLTDNKNSFLNLIQVGENLFISPKDNALYEFLLDDKGVVKYVRKTDKDSYNNDYRKQK